MRLYLLIISIVLICTGCFGNDNKLTPQQYKGFEEREEGQIFSSQATKGFHMSYTFFGTTQSQINLVDRTGGNLQVISPTYFDINTDGTLKLNTYQLSQTFINEMHKRGIRVVPFLSNHWDRNIGRAGLANREELSTQIAQAIQTYNLDGVNVDIENVTHVDKDDFTDLVRLLRTKIPQDKEVSVAVAINPNGWTLGWHGMYDYKSLHKYSDYLMVMGYDESYVGGPPGPVASASWVEKGIVEILKHAPANKIVLGLPFFGRYWQDGATVGGHGIAKHMADTLAQRYNGIITFDEQSQSPRLNFTIRESDPTTTVSGRTLQPGTYTFWFENQRSLQSKFNLIDKYSLLGSGSWALGLENSGIWAQYGNWTTLAPVRILVGKQIMGVVTSSTLNIQREPGTISEKVGQLQSGDTVVLAGEIVQGSQKSWYPIHLENAEVGYISSDFVSLVNTNTLFGPNRFSTSVNISKDGFEQGSETVVIGRGDKSVDALPGSVLAAKHDAPLLLTRPDTLPADVLEEIKRLGAKRVFLLGGEGAISAQIRKSLEQNGISVQRISGANRYDTSVQIANEIGIANELILVTGQATSPDPLAIAPYAGLKQIPMLLSPSQSLSKEVRAVVKEKDVKKVTLIGGDKAISAEVVEELRALGVTSVERISGPDRFSTSVEIAKRYADELNPENIYFVSGFSFIDALAGSPLASRERAPIILTSKDSIPTSVQNWIRLDGRINSNTQINFLGGSTVITTGSRAQVLQQITQK